MYKNSFIDNPTVILSLLAFVIIINILLPVHFISLLLIGVIYTAFTKLLKEENYTLFTLVIIAFSIIELAQGLKLFSLSLLAFFIHIIISPLFNKIFTSKKLVRVIIVFIFILELYYFLAF